MSTEQKQNKDYTVIHSNNTTTKLQQSDGVNTHHKMSKHNLNEKIMVQYEHYFKNNSIKNKKMIGPPKDKTKFFHSVLPQALPYMDKEFQFIRDYKNCISNYALLRSNIKSTWVNQNETMEINNKQNKYKSHTQMDWETWCDDDDHNKQYIRLHRINWNYNVISLLCPNCHIFYQTIPLNETTIAFICYNFPQCGMPFNYDHLLWRNDFIWTDVKYVGPILNEDQINEHLKSFSTGNDLDNIYDIEEITDQKNMTKKLKQRMKHKQKIRQRKFNI